MRFVKTRWFLAAVSLAISARLMVVALGIPSLSAAGSLIMSVAAFLLSVLLIVPETAFRLAELCSRPITNLIFPSERFDKPPLSYQIARRYRTMQRLEEALAEYKEIIKDYPDELEAYVELIEVATKLGDDKARQKYEAVMERRFEAVAAQ